MSKLVFQLQKDKGATMKSVLRSLIYIIVLFCLGCTANDTDAVPTSSLTTGSYPLPETILTADMLSAVNCVSGVHYCPVEIHFSVPWPDGSFDVIVEGAEREGASFSEDRKVLTVVIFPGETIESRRLRITITSASAEITLDSQIHVLAQ